MGNVKIRNLYVTIEASSFSKETENKPGIWGLKERAHIFWYGTEKLQGLHFSRDRREIINQLALV